MSLRSIFRPLRGYASLTSEGRSNRWMISIYALYFLFRTNAFWPTLFPFSSKPRFHCPSGSLVPFFIKRLAGCDDKVDSSCSTTPDPNPNLLACSHPAFRPIADPRARLTRQS